MSVSKPFPAPGTLPYYAPLKEWADDVEAQVDDETLEAKFGAVGTSLAEGNVTLVTVPRVITLTGATQSRTVTLPAGVYDARVFNDTDYEHILIRTGSANGTPIAPGAAVEIVSA